MKKITFLAIFGLAMFTNDVKAQIEPFLGQISFVAFNFAPQGWAECNGQILPINNNQALFSLLGTQYGGNGQTTFALPDMRGRTVINAGQSPGLSSYNQGQTGGQESVTLNSAQMPQHRHEITAVTADGNQSSPTGNLPANTKTLDKEYSDQSSNTTMKSGMVAAAGGGQAHENRSPYLVLKCIIATQGVYPSRP